MDAIDHYPVVLNYDEKTLRLVTLANEIGVERTLAILTAAQPLGDKAVGVLEAAGKCDRGVLLKAEFFWPHNELVGFNFSSHRQAIRALLEALPEAK